MLDVHPPHAPTHTWKDFFIHIATIVIGLLIAVGLEQTIEYFHHRHQVAETRAALRAEHEDNRLQLNTAVVMMRREHAALANNLMVLLYIKQHPGTPQAELPGILTWHSDLDTLPTVAWRTASQSSVLVLFPSDEVRTEGDFYSHIDGINQANIALYLQIVDAHRYSFRDRDPTHLTSAELDSTIQLTLQCMKASTALDVAIMNLKDHFPDYAQGLTYAEINRFTQALQAESDPELARPIAQTIERIDAAGKLNDYFPQVVPGKQ
jgi:hypothetical protein